MEFQAERPGFKDLFLSTLFIGFNNWHWLACGFFIRLIFPLAAAAVAIMALSDLKWIAVAVAALTASCLYLYFDYGFLGLKLDLAASKNGNLNSLFAPIDKRFFNYALTFLTVMLGFVAGTVLLVVPGIIFLSRFCLAVPLTIWQSKGIVEALSESLKLTKGSALQLGALLTLMIVLCVIFNAVDTFSGFFWLAVCYFLVRIKSDSTVNLKPAFPGFLKISLAVVGFPLVLALFTIFSLVIMRFFLEARYIPSQAMIPTLNVEDRIIVEKSNRFGIRKLKRGDIVLFYPPPSEMPEGKDLSNDISHVLGRLTGLPFLPYEPAFIKRVIGVPGDTIKVVNGVGVFVNDKQLDQPYVNETPAYDLKLLGDIGMTGRTPYSGRPPFTPEQARQPIVVGRDQLFVMGDNRNNSQDSHVWGFLSSHRVIGRAWLKIYPEPKFF